jgi:hypothetical protein
MAFKKGHKLARGRPKGSLNKKSLLLKDSFEAKGFDLLTEILKRLPALDPKDQVSALLQLMPYAHPKLSSVQIVAPPDDERPLKDIEDSVLEATLVGGSDDPY